MRVKTEMIDKELRWAARVGRYIMRPSPWFVRALAKLTRKIHPRLQAIAGLRCEETWVPRSDGDSRLRACVFRPIVCEGPVPALLYLHPGGYVLGTPETSWPIIRALIETRDCVVIAPDYRKSLEAPYPAAIDDCYDTLVWIKDNARELGVRSDQIMVGGHSAGGGLTASLTLRARDRGDVRIAFQMPIYPMIDDRMESESARDNDAPLWSSKMNELAWGLYLRDLQRKGQPIPYDAAPARAADYTNLPPTMTYVGDLEVFRDETIAYVENLKKAGVPVEFVVFKGCFHGFDIFVPKARVSKEATAFTVRCFADAVDNYVAPQAS